MALPLPQAGAMNPTMPQPQRSGGSFWTGTPASIQQFARFNPMQQNVQNQSVNQALSLLGQLGQRPAGGGFEPIAQQARQQFQTQTLPTLAERFTAMGGQRSSAYPSSLANAGVNLETNLAALGSQYGLQERSLDQQLLNQLLGTALTPSYETAYMPRQPGFFESAAQPALSGIGSLLPLLLTGGTSGLLSVLSLLGGR